MKTTAIGVQNLCVPCACRCGYCLLSYSGSPVGVDYERGKRFTERFFGELAQDRPELKRFFHIGYCMDTPKLADYISFCRELGSPSGDFLRLNGLVKRDEGQTQRFAQVLAEAGIRSVDLTFFGLREFHDKFAGRPGDFDHLCRLASAVSRAGIQIDVSLPILRDNMAQGPALLEALSEIPVRRFFAFLPHCKGRGWALRDQRLTRGEFDALPDKIRACFSPNVEYKSEWEWLQCAPWPLPESRTLTLSLTAKTIGRLEKMPASEIVEMLESLDDRYYAAVPGPWSLAMQYGDPDGEKMYRLRDLLLEYRRRWFFDHGAGLHNVDDEVGHFSVRS